MFKSRPFFNSGFTLAFIAVAMFSSKSIFIKLAYEYGVDTTTLMTWRMLLAMPFYLYMLLRVLQHPMRQPISVNSVSSMIVLGLMGYYAASWLDLYALNFITAHYERIVLYTYPAFVLIINALWQKRPIRLVELSSLTLAYTGLLLIFYYDLSNLGEAVITGTLLVLASSLSFSFYVVGSQKYSGKYGSKFFTCVAMLAATAAIVSHFAITHSLTDLLQPLPVLVYAAAIAIIATVIPSFLMNAAIEKIGANNASISGSLGPVLTTVFAIFLLDEIFTFVHAVGMTLVIAGIYYLSKKHKS
ncbi:DMT family transporter [Catenovulum agarivorans]|uniref:DMT family transporter n=1 Tax=Catenovulum agarivorans TaxID=1172192 RepID=UPI000555F68C|nr:DMT family transporter [Catenovulum agarivorans]